MATAARGPGKVPGTPAPSGPSYSQLINNTATSVPVKPKW